MLSRGTYDFPIWCWFSSKVLDAVKSNINKYCRVCPGFWKAGSVESNCLKERLLGTGWPRS